MYVCRLDRDWVGTPFPLQGLMVRSADDVRALSAYCRHVYVDTALGRAPDEPLLQFEAVAARRQYTSAEVERLRNTVSWTNQSTFGDEVPLARDAQHRVTEVATRILDDVRSGRSISTDEVRVAVEPIVRSVLRNVDAFLWVESLRKRDAYEYTHALNCSALAAAFGRHVGFPEDVLTDLAAGGLLLDIGKLRVNQDLLLKQGEFSAAETADMQQHVELGLAIVGEGAPLPAHAIDMIATHHERIDGTGYPRQLVGSQIPLQGRIAAVIDSYDAMTSDRGHRKAISRHDALQELYRERGTRYAAETVEQFMQCLSIYPVGSLVLLNDRRVAVVMAQNGARRLLPRVMVITRADKQIADQFVELDLMRQPKDAAATLWIAGALPPGAWGLDPTELYL